MGSSVTGISLFASLSCDCMVTADRRQLEIKASGILCRAVGDKCAAIEAERFISRNTRFVMQTYKRVRIPA